MNPHVSITLKGRIVVVLDDHEPCTRKQLADELHLQGAAFTPDKLHTALVELVKEKKIKLAGDAKNFLYSLVRTERAQ